MTVTAVQPRGRTVLAKTCDRCGILRLRGEYSGMNPSGHRVCKKCVREKLRSTRMAQGKQLKFLHRRAVLLAATCGTCGEFKQAAEFKGRRNGTPVTSRCRACHYLLESGPTPEQALSAMQRHRADRQATTLPSATRHGQQWTGPELEIAARDDLTATEVGLMLGRSYAAVCLARQKLKRDPKWAQVAGVVDA